MNAYRRKLIANAITKIEDLVQEIEDIKSDEEEVKDNMPENLQGSERYELMVEAVENIESAICSLDEAKDYLDSIE